MTEVKKPQQSKLAQKFAAGHAARESREAAAQSAPSPALLVQRPQGPLHGAVSNMKIEMLAQEVRDLRSGKPMLRLDPAEICPSPWKNRHEDSFQLAEFVELRQEIRGAGGNVQPIKVRPIQQAPGSPYKYEVVFGRRRHRACLAEGLQVLAIIEEMTDAQLFAEMDRENRQREDLRPYEQGTMYADALDRGLFPSLRRLAESLGVDASNVAKVVTLARFPQQVISAFVSPLDIQYRWISDIKAALDSDSDLVLSRSAGIVKARASGKAISSSQAYAKLLGREQKAKRLKPRVSKFGSSVLSVSQRGEKVAFEVVGIDKERLDQIEKFIAGLMAKSD